MVQTGILLVLDYKFLFKIDFISLLFLFNFKKYNLNLYYFDKYIDKF